jgi:hypothetical protein
MFQSNILLAGCPLGLPVSAVTMLAGQSSEMLMNFYQTTQYHSLEDTTPVDSQHIINLKTTKCI